MPPCTYKPKKRSAANREATRLVSNRVDKENRRTTNRSKGLSPGVEKPRRERSVLWEAMLRVPKRGNPPGRKGRVPFRHKRTTKESRNDERNPTDERKKDSNR